MGSEKPHLRSMRGSWSGSRLKRSSLNQAFRKLAVREDGSTHYS